MGRRVFFFFRRVPHRPASSAFLLAAPNDLSSLSGRFSFLMDRS
jgi:hypothetical protein